MKKLLKLSLFTLILCTMIYLMNYKADQLELIFSQNLLYSAYKFVIYFLTIKIVSNIIYYLFRKKKALKSSARDNFYFGILNIGNLLIGIGVIVSIFDGLGIDFRTLLTSMSIIAAAIAIISKEYINDFLLGIYYSFSNNIEIDDYVKIGEHKGKILEIEMLKIKLMNDNDEILILPNYLVYSSEIINYSKSDIGSLSIDFQLDIQVIGKIELLELELFNELKEFEEFIEKDSFILKIIELKKDLIDFKLMYRLKTQNLELQKRIRRKTIRKIYNFVLNKTVE